MNFSELSLKQKKKFLNTLDNYNSDYLEISKNKKFKNSCYYSIVLKSSNLTDILKILINNPKIYLINAFIKNSNFLLNKKANVLEYLLDINDYEVTITIFQYLFENKLLSSEIFNKHFKMFQTQSMFMLIIDEFINNDLLETIDNIIKNQNDPSYQYLCYSCFKWIYHSMIESPSNKISIKHLSAFSKYKEFNEVVKHRMSFLFNNNNNYNYNNSIDLDKIIELSKYYYDNYYLIKSASISKQNVYEIYKTAINFIFR